MIIIAIYIIRNWRPTGTTEPQPLGRYSGQRAIDRATPICLAMLPHHDDLYAGVEETWGAAPRASAHVYWDVAFSDGQGNKRIQVIGDANSGAVRRVRRVVRSDSALRDRGTPPMSAAKAVACAQAWMHTLGFTEDWQLATNPQSNTSRWKVQLRANGMTACLNLDLQRGSLIFADITPAH